MGVFSLCGGGDPIGGEGKRNKGKIREAAPPKG